MALINIIAHHTPEPIKRVIRPIISPFLNRGDKKYTNKLYSNFISKEDIVFDIGAHKGSMTKIFLNLGAKVVCVEPQPDCVKILRENFSKNENVFIVPMGVSDKVGNLKLYICNEGTAISTFSEKWKSSSRLKNRGLDMKLKDKFWGKGVNIKVTTLDALIKKYGLPKFCKIDVEGYELNVLRGLKSKINGLSFEFTVEFLAVAKECVDVILKFGEAEFNFSLNGRFKLQSKNWISKEELFKRLDLIKNKDVSGDIFVRYI